MNRRHRFVLGALAALAPALLLPAAAAAECPAPGKIEQSIKKVFKRDIDVKKVSQSPVPGLCEVLVSFQGRPNFVYTDPAGDYFVTGHLVDAKAGLDLTEEAIASLNAFSVEEMEKVAALSTLTLGTKGPVVYFATDPM